MTIGAQIFNSIYNAMPDARASLRFSDVTFEAACLCASIQGGIQVVEYGIGIATAMSVKILKCSDFDAVFPSVDLSIGRSVTLTKDGVEYRYRTQAFSLLSGVITYTLSMEVIDG